MLLNGGILPAGSYVIPAEVTLLIPFDDECTLYLDSPASTGEQNTPYAYRTLNLAEGAALTVSGTLSLSAKHQYASIDGCSARPIGSYGHINMAGGSSIRVGSGGKLYAWGYITGGGEVIAEDGAEVYEVFQIMDFRGAVGQSMKNGVYPFSQYYVQNIEVPLKMYAGSTEYALTSTNVSGTVSSSLFPFIGAMLNQTSGYLVKDYQEGSDRLRIDLYGNAMVSGFCLELGSVLIDAADFVLPVTSNMTITAHSGELMIGQDLALLPGSELVIGSAAEAIIAPNSQVYAYGAAWSAGTDAKLWPALYAPGRAGRRTAASLVDAKIHIGGKLTVAGDLYTTRGGANIIGESGATVTLKPGQETLTYQLQQSEGTNAYKSIEITSAQLKNADGSCALTGKAKSEAVYTCVEGRWACGVWTLTDGVWSCAEASPHAALVTQAEVPPSCETDGKTAGEHCEVCGYSVQEQTVIPMTGHSLPEGWAITPATCTGAGMKVCRCQNDGCTYEEVETIKAQGHAWSDWTESKAASCTAAGEKLRSCLCGETETEMLPTLGHDWADANCTAPKTCKREGCGITEGEALGHSWTTATCTDAKRCTTCKLTEGEALGHDWVEADCTTPKTCKTCGATQGFELGHTIVIDAGKAPTCTEPGLTEGSHCSLCGEVIVAQTVIEATAHANKYAGYGFEPDCTRAGWNAGLYCPDCDTWLEEQNEIPPLGHDLGEGVEAIPPTCTQSGVMAYPCQRCSNVASVDIPPRHTPVKIEAVSPTEDKEGATEGSKCSACGKILVQPEVIPALGRPTPEGWAHEEGGWFYYADGAYFTGVAVVDGLYYDFGESGLNPDKTPYTGLLAVDGENYYIRKGKPETGWQLIGESWYYFDTATDAGLDSEHLVNGQVYPFVQGKLLHGVWVRDDVGLMYFYGPGNYDKGWQVIEGEEYFFQRGYVTTGIAPVRESQDKPVYWYAFTDAGMKLGYAADGFHWYEGDLYYIVDGSADRFGMHCIDGDYYYFTYDDYAVRSQTFEVVQTNGLVPAGIYTFGEDGRLQVRLPGDANRDDVVGADDAALVFAYIAGQTVDIDLANANVNADGRIDQADGLLTMQYAAGWEVELR